MSFYKTQPSWHYMSHMYLEMVRIMSVKMLDMKKANELPLFKMDVM